jgi:hypothetical protein
MRKPSLNQLRLSSAKRRESVCIILYNKDSYSSHCKDYKEYQEWLENRNESRYLRYKVTQKKLMVKYDALSRFNYMIEIGEVKVSSLEDQMLLNYLKSDEVN